MRIKVQRLTRAHEESAFNPLVARHGMTGRFPSGLFTVTILLLSALLPLVSASGGGLLLTSSSLIIEGDQEVGVGAVNASIEVTSMGQFSNGSLEMQFETISGTPLASENRTINLTTDQSSIESFSIIDVPIGQHLLTLRLWGDVGTPDSENLTVVTRLITRLAPASLVVSSSSSWTLTGLDGGSGNASGNQSIRDGDLLHLQATISNEGGVNWTGLVQVWHTPSQGQSTLSLNDSVSIAGGSSTVINLTIGPLFEGNHQLQVLIANSGDGDTSDDSDSVSFSVGPPPLARLALSGVTDVSDPSLDDEVTWNLSITNSGEVNWSGSLACEHPAGIEVTNQSLMIAVGETWNDSMIINVRPGSLSCSTTDLQRIHDDSVSSFSHDYDMAAGHLILASTSGLAAYGGPFHVGDEVPLSVLVHNDGDQTGGGELQIREGEEGGSFGPWLGGIPLTLDVGSSRELENPLTPLASGNRSIEWRVVSDDSLVDSNLSGSFSLAVIPAQTLEVNLTIGAWTLADGLSLSVESSLGDGRARMVTLDVGTTDSAGDNIQISTEILLATGMRSFSFDLGQPSSAHTAWVQATPIGWTAAGDAFDSSTLIRPEAIAATTLGSPVPSSPTVGDRVQLQYALRNDGNAATLPGSVTLIDVRTNEVIWTDSAPIVAAGDEEDGTIVLEDWPEGAVVDIRLEWHTDTTSTSVFGSYTSTGPDDSTGGLAFDWTSLVYGLLAGLVMGLVARTAMRAKAGVPLVGGRSSVSGSSRQPAAEKSEVACPACDQRLRVPSDYTGSARCPSCSITFPVVREVPEEPEEPAVHEEPAGPEGARESVSTDSTDSASIPQPVTVQSEPEFDSKPTPIISKVEEKTSSSDSDVIRCPDCSQKLKVPYDRRPVKARCPACKCEFRALAE